MVFNLIYRNNVFCSVTACGHTLRSLISIVKTTGDCCFEKCCFVGRQPKSRQVLRLRSAAKFYVVFFRQINKRRGLLVKFGKYIFVLRGRFVEVSKLFAYVLAAAIGGVYIEAHPAVVGQNYCHSLARGQRFEVYGLNFFAFVTGKVAVVEICAVCGVYN